jgi:RNA polymerase sigma-70 factor (ECF subfamily)
MITYTIENIKPKPIYQRDQELIQDVRNGNSSALDEFYLLNRREFLKWSEKLFGLDSAKAMDIYQDAILILYENIKRGKLSHLNSSLKTYLYGIGKNLTLNKMAREKAEKKRWQEVYSFEETEEITLYPDVREESLDAVKSCLEGLSNRNQAILKLYYYRRLPLKLIAEQLGYENVDVVKNQKVRCIKYLKKLVEDRLNDTN